jgi:threonine-phosphate decarboxylase
MSNHGGNVYEAARKYGIAVEKIVDFSASINPLGMPKEAGRCMKKAMANLRHYPETYGDELASRIASRLGVESQSIICGNGSTELIYLIPRVLKPAKVLIPEPTFREYERASIIGSSPKIVGFRLKREDDFDISPDAFMQALSSIADTSQSVSIAFLCNPNNPTGRLLSKRDILKIAKAAQDHRCYLVVDEAFIDICAAESVCHSVSDNPYLIVLRSMTKFYAIPGLRIGYGVFHPTLATKVREYKEPWTINSLAQVVGGVVLDDHAFDEQTLTYIAQEKAFLENSMRNLGISFIPSVANYYLLHLSNAVHVRQELEHIGILVRDCSNFTGLDETYLRIAVRTRRENRLLLKEMERICKDS